MINRFSASAAEIAAAALQDYGRALIVGDMSTHGKGTVQNLNPLKPFMINSTNDPGAIENHHPQILPRQRRFHAAQRRECQTSCCRMSIIIQRRSAKRIWTIRCRGTPSSRPAMKSSIWFSRIVPELHKSSDARIATNQDFAYVRKDIEQYKKSQSDRTITLNEREAIKEREQQAA